MVRWSDPLSLPSTNPMKSTSSGRSSFASLVMRLGHARLYLPTCSSDWESDDEVDLTLRHRLRAQGRYDQFCLKTVACRPIRF
jgi:hypothetical protein